MELDDLNKRYPALNTMFTRWEESEHLCQLFGDTEAADLMRLVCDYIVALTQTRVQEKKIALLQAEKEALNQQLKDLTKGVLAALNTDGDSDILSAEYA